MIATKKLPKDQIADYISGTTQAALDLKSNDLQVYKTISGNTTLDNTYHNATIWVTTTCNITIPSGLRIDFNATFRTFSGVTATFVASGTTINAQSDGSIMAAKSMAYVGVYSTNNYIIAGGGLS